MAHDRTRPTILDTAAALRALDGRVSRSALFDAIRTGELPSSRPARRRLIAATALARWAGVPVADLHLDAPAD